MSEDKKKRTNKIFVLGIIVLVISAAGSWDGLGVVGFFMAFISGFTLFDDWKKRNQDTELPEVLSFLNKSMPDNDLFSTSSKKYTSSVKLEKNKGEHDENGSECPICKTHSYNGYCSVCGYRFK